jgi:hypothetical protein
MYGITKDGFVRPTLQEILDDVKDAFIGKFGQGILLTDSSVAGKLAAIQAERENELWKLMEAVYSSTTLNGAEGKYLNDILAKRGLFRRSAQAGSGTVHIKTDSTCPNSTIISKGTQYKGNNGQIYKAEQDVLVTDFVSGFMINASDVKIGPYEFYMDDISGGETYRFVYTVKPKIEDGLSTQTPDPESVRTLFSSLVSFINSVSGNVFSQYCHIKDDNLYVGYNSNKVFTALPKSVSMYFTSPVGEKYTSIPVVCTKKGLYPLEAYGIQDMIPKPVGLVSIENVAPFYSGNDVETDDEYRLRHSSNKAVLSRGTPSSMIETLQNMSGVEDVILYENPTDDINHSPAKPHTAMFVVLGGVASDIVKELYKNKPIKTVLDGEYSEKVLTADGRYERVGFTPAVQKQITVKIEYTTKNALPLNISEKENISNALKASVQSLSIGESVQSEQLVASALSNISFSRIKTLKVFVKYTGSGDETYKEGQLKMAFNEAANLLVENILFIQGRG